jgi:hypothetical protein
VGDTLRILIESGKTKTFASALDWPGWSRSGKTEVAAVESLLAYAERFRFVPEIAGVAFQVDFKPQVVDCVQGGGATDFGVPEKVHQIEREPVDESEIARQLEILKASWTFFGDVRDVVSAELRKGPRGGGRDRDKIVDHVIQADRGYARHIGVRTPVFDTFDDAAVEAHHLAVFEAIPGLRAGLPEGEKGWPVRYAIRRMAWHILDHAWEMQDKDLTPKETN